MTPHLAINGAAEAIEFYKKAFGAEEIRRMPAPDGKRLMHAEIKIGDSIVMLHDEFPEYGPRNSPGALGGTTVSLHLYVTDADAAYNRAVAAGATATMPLMDMFWGDRYGKLKDPFGHEWSVATQIKQMSPADLAAASAEAFKQKG